MYDNAVFFALVICLVIVGIVCVFVAWYRKVPWSEGIAAIRKARHADMRVIRGIDPPTGELSKFDQLQLPASLALFLAAAVGLWALFCGFLGIEWLGLWAILIWVSPALLPALIG